MIHLYEMTAGRGDPYWEVWNEFGFVRSIHNQNEFDLYLDIHRQAGVDFVIHTLEEYDEYHIALPSV